MDCEVTLLSWRRPQRVLTCTHRIALSISLRASAQLGLPQRMVALVPPPAHAAEGRAGGAQRRAGQGSREGVWLEA